MQQPNKKLSKKHWYKRWWTITLFVLVGLGALGSVAPDEQSQTRNQQSQQQVQATQKPDYEIKIAGSSYVDPATRSLTFTVKNIGSADGNPSCDATLENDTGTYRGFDTITWNTPLKPGETKYFEGNFIITNRGAAYATKSHVSCIERAY